MESLGANRWGPKNHQSSREGDSSTAEFWLFLFERRYQGNKGWLNLRTEIETQNALSSSEVIDTWPLTGLGVTENDYRYCMLPRWNPLLSHGFSIWMRLWNRRCWTTLPTEAQAKMPTFRLTSPQERTPSTSSTGVAVPFRSCKNTLGPDSTTGRSTSSPFQEPRSVSSSDLPMLTLSSPRNSSTRPMKPQNKSPGDPTQSRPSLDGAAPQYDPSRTPHRSESTLTWTSAHLSSSAQVNKLLLPSRLPTRLNSTRHGHVMPMSRRSNTANVRLCYVPVNNWIAKIKYTFMNVTTLLTYNYCSLRDLNLIRVPCHVANKHCPRQCEWLT